MWRLKKALYGLKQSSAIWYDTLKKALVKEGYTQSQVDCCLFFDKKDNIWFCFHVDDFFIIAKEDKAVDTLAARLRTHFELTYVSGAPVKSFLAIEYNQDLVKGTTTLSQRNYAEELLTRLGMQDCAPVPTPLTLTTTEPQGEGGIPTSPPLSPPDHLLYRDMVGSINFLVGTRPDLAVAVSRLAQHLAAPTDVDMQAAKRVLRYVRGTINLGIRFTKDSPPLTGPNAPMNQRDTTKLQIFSDANWAPEDDAKRRSTTGTMAMLNGGPVYCKSTRQHTVALSSLQSEYQALSYSARIAMHLRRLLFEMDPDAIGVTKPDTYPTVPDGMLEGTTRPTNIWEDNQGAAIIACNPVNGERSKHIETQHHYVRECVENGHFQIPYIPTEFQLADILTKGLCAATFTKLRDQFMYACKV